MYISNDIEICARNILQYSILSSSPTDGYCHVRQGHLSDNYVLLPSVMTGV